MTDEERDALLIEIRDTLRDHGERLTSIGAVLNTHAERLERIEGRQATQSGQLGALGRDLDTLNRESRRRP